MMNMLRGMLENKLHDLETNEKVLRLERGLKRNVRVWGNGVLIYPIDIFRMGQVMGDLYTDLQFPDKRYFHIDAPGFDPNPLPPLSGPLQAVVRKFLSERGIKSIEDLAEFTTALIAVFPGAGKVAKWWHQLFVGQADPWIWRPAQVRNQALFVGLALKSASKLLNSQFNLPRSTREEYGRPA
jgi:hypothetical protein